MHISDKISLMLHSTVLRHVQVHSTLCLVQCCHAAGLHYRMSAEPSDQTF